MAPTDPKQTKPGGGFFASIASTISTFGSAMHKSVNGMIGYEGLEVINPEGSTEDAEEEAQRGRWRQEDRDSYWRMMQKYIGSDVTSMVTLPVIIFEPMTMLQKVAERLPLSFNGGGRSFYSLLFSLVQSALSLFPTLQCRNQYPSLLLRQAEQQLAGLKSRRQEDSK